MNNELYHHGILGMKWGMRKYQNKDGTLTAAGKKHYGKLHGKYLDKVNARYEHDREKSKHFSQLEQEARSTTIQEYRNRHLPNEPDLDYVRSDRQRLIREYTSISENFADRAKSWCRLQKELMNIPLGQLKSKKEYIEFLKSHECIVLFGQPINCYY